MGAFLFERRIYVLDISDSDRNWHVPHQPGSHDGIAETNIHRLQGRYAGDCIPHGIPSVALVQGQEASMNRPLTIMEELLSRLDSCLFELYDERAGIIQFDGGFSRDHAECLALLNVILRHPLALSRVRLLRLEEDGETSYLLTTKTPEVLTSCTKIDDPANVIDTMFGGVARLVRKNDHLI
jgi:hypothetical protein